MKPKDTRISVRVDQEMKDRLEKAVADTGIDEPTLVKRCVEALLNYIEENGSITFPLEVLPVARPKSGTRTSYPSHRAGHHEMNEPEEKPKDRKSKAA